MKLVILLHMYAYMSLFPLLVSWHLMLYIDSCKEALDWLGERSLAAGLVLKRRINHASEKCPGSYSPCYRRRHSTSRRKGCHAPSNWSFWS